MISENISGKLPRKRSKLSKLYKGSVPIFDHFGVNKQIKALFGKTVSFKHGAYLIIDHTEALHVIDVNSGNRSRTGQRPGIKCTGGKSGSSHRNCTATAATRYGRYYCYRFYRYAIG